MRCPRAAARQQAPRGTTPDGKLTPELIGGRLRGRGDDHFAQPGVVAVTQLTEFGTCYYARRAAGIARFLPAEDLRVFLDGARLANAAAYLGCSLAELAECADVLSFGGTKNGAMAAEALIVMRGGHAADVPYLRKQQTQLTSKMRFIAAQFGALLQDELWRANAPHANAMARGWPHGVRAMGRRRSSTRSSPMRCSPGSGRGTSRLLQRDWASMSGTRTSRSVRWMTAFDTSAADVDAFVARSASYGCAT